MTNSLKDCPKCGKRRRTHDQSTTVTPWLFETQWCLCDYYVETTPQPDSEFCSICGKRQTSVRAGSLTQWIFQADKCTCPSSKTFVPKAALVSTDSVRSTAEELGLDHDNFPLERYEPLEVLGRGAAGKVIKARDRVLKKKVAIKVLHKVEPDLLLNFQNEARAMSLMTHENIAAVLDFGATSGGRPYMVMEFIQGDSLKKVLQSHECLPWRSVVTIAIQLCRALTYAHSKGVIHRDLKSANIITDIYADKPNAKIIDFGIAVTLSREDQLSKGLTIAGTPEYMSPDQIQGKRYDERSEIYSLGCVMFESLTGRLPYKGEKPLDVMRNHTYESIPHFEDIAAHREVPRELENIVRVCLNKTPEDRYSNFEELRFELEGLTAADKTITQRLPDPPNQIKPQPQHSNVAPVLLSVVLGMVAGSLLTFLAMKASDRISERPKVVPEELQKTSAKKTTGGTALNALSLAYYMEEEDLPEDLEIDTLQTAFDNIRKSDASICEKIDIGYNLIYALRDEHRDNEASKVFLQLKDLLGELDKEISLHRTENVFVGNAPLVYLEIGKIECDRNKRTAETLLKKGLELAAFHVESGWVKADLLDQLGRLYQETGRNMEAENALKEAITRRESYGSDGEKQNQKSYQTLSLALEGQLKPAEALEWRKKAEALRQRQGHRRQGSRQNH